jgi:hypothetical protein
VTLPALNPKLSEAAPARAALGDGLGIFSRQNNG